MEMGKAGMAPSAKYARQWRLASAAIEEIDIGADDDEEPLVSRGRDPGRISELEDLGRSRRGGDLDLE